MNCLSERSIVYHETRGFGIVCGCRTISAGIDMAEVLFSDGTKANVQTDFLLPVPEGSIAALSGDRADALFDSSASEKGTVLFRNRKISSARIDAQRKFAGNAEDGTEYHVSLWEKDGQLFSECGCEAGHNCCHAYALGLTLQNIFNKLYFSDAGRKLSGSEAAARAEIARELPAEFKSLADSIASYIEIPFSRCREAAYSLGEKQNEAYLEEYLLYCQKSTMSQECRDEQLDAIFLHESSGKMLRKMLVREDCCKNLFSYVRRFRLLCNETERMSTYRYRLYSPSRFPALAAKNHYYNGRDDAAVTELLSGEEKWKPMHLALLCAVTASAGDNEKIASLCRKYLDSNLPLQVRAALLAGLPDARRAQLYALGSKYPVLAKDFAAMPSELQYRYADALQLMPDCIPAMKPLIRELLDRGENRKAAGLIAKASDRFGCAALRPITEMLPYGACFCAFLSAYGEKKNEYRPVLRSILTGIRAEDSEHLLDYFQLEYQLYENDQTDYTLTLPGLGLTLLSLHETPDGCLITQSLLARSDAPVFAEAVLKAAKGQYADEIRRGHEMLEQQRLAKEEQQRKNLLLDEIERFRRNTEAAGAALAENSLADVEFAFSDEVHYGEYRLEMRVGISRFYVVRRPMAFFDAIRYETSVQYGKQLAFCHRLENFKEDKREALSYLTSVFGDRLTGSTDKYLSVSTEVLIHLLEALRGCRIFWNDTPIAVTLEPRHFRYCLNPEGVLEMADPSAAGLQVIYGYETLLLDMQRARMDILAGDRTEKQLFRLAKQLRGRSLADVLTDFRDGVYASAAELIDIAPELQDKMTVSELTIEAYFDFQKTDILLRTRYMRGDAEVPETAVSLPLDLSRDRAYRQYITDMGFAPEQENGLRVLSDDSKILQFFRMDFSDLKKLCRVYLSEEIRGKSLMRLGREVIRIEYHNNLFEAFLAETVYTDRELESILKAIRKKKKFVLLSGSRIVALDDEDALQFAETVADLGLNEKALSERQQVSVVQSLKAMAHQSSCEADEYLRRMTDDLRAFKENAYPLPAVRAELRQYQKEGYYWLKTLAKYHMGGILADEMGLGKTLEMITLLKSDDTPAPSLVVCPKSLVFNWLNEFRRFDGETKVISLYGQQAQRRQQLEEMAADEKAVYITSYDSLRQDAGLYTAPFRYLILDEGQFIKNIHARKTLSVKGLNAEFRFVLTGTPIENNILDLWSIFDFLMPGYFDEVSEFRNRWMREEAYEGLVTRRAAPFILRRTKAEVLHDLPEKFERILTAEMTPEQRKCYEAYQTEARRRMEKGGKAFELLPYLTRLRQLCDDPGLFLENYTGGSGKMDTLTELTETYLENGHKLLVFSQFVTALQKAAELLKERNIEYYMLDGSTPAEKRMEMTERFNEPGGVGVFLISLKAGGSGLNLTGADTVIHLDPWWNPAAEEQASDRAHRIGQKRQVEVIRLIAENSIEQKVIELQDLKKDLIDRVIAHDDSAVSSVTLEDIAFLLH